MEFQLPQFIETETRIAGPLTFKQFTYLGIAAVILVALYFILKPISITLFIIIAVILGGGALVFAFLKIGGRPSLTTLINFFAFIFSPKTYLWKKKTISPKIIQRQFEAKKKTAEEEQEPHGPTLKIVEKSRLKKLSTQIETQSK